MDNDTLLHVIVCTFGPPLLYLTIKYMIQKIERDAAVSQSAVESNGLGLNIVEQRPRPCLNLSQIAESCTSHPQPRLIATSLLDHQVDMMPTLTLASEQSVDTLPRHDISPGYMV